MRGKLITDVFGVFTGGLIPACAGKTTTFCAGMSEPWAHPRVCGENRVGGGGGWGYLGSSPRVRGKPAPRPLTASRSRLIPACAGKTWVPGFFCFLGWAHPRVCGENPSNTVIALQRAGSSPRVRGKPRDARIVRPRPGLIPACAGKTLIVTEVSWARQAHPRVCGENCRLAVENHRDRRLIPACAGKTRVEASDRRAVTAHPRVCGENTHSRVLGTLTKGSSPRVRGKRCLGFFRLRPRRLIPACAGKTQRESTAREECGAHPRVCGEN